MAYDSSLREKEIENKLRNDFFKDYDATPVLGDIDFAVAVPSHGAFETEYLLWAEAKKGIISDINESFVQLIMTIGKARTFDRYLPPAFLGAFDSKKIAFIPYNTILDIFSQNDFNWNVTPSDHSTKEFRQIYNIVNTTLNQQTLTFHFDQDRNELILFIKKNFIIGKSRLSKIRISKNNYISIYQKWLKEVKPTIAVNWSKAKENDIIDADFYLADILSQHNITLKEKLFVLLRQDHYELDRKLDESGFFDSKKAQFNDEQKAHIKFWNRYVRPPKREFWDEMANRRDRLVPQDVRERKGSYFTPQKWVELSQQYLAYELGDNWQDEYYIWDCAAGTGNLLNGLVDKYKIWASTIDQADVDVMRDRIKNGANLLDRHVFQFDFLNDPFDKLPDELREIIYNEEKRKKLLIYINPPYAEASNARQRVGTGFNRKSLATETYVYQRYSEKYGSATRELFAQFMIRIYEEIPSSLLANFSTLKNLQATNFLRFRNHFRAKLGRAFMIPASTFDNVRGVFPIGFFIWNLALNEKFNETYIDAFDNNGIFMFKKLIASYDSESKIINWLRRYYDKESTPIAYLQMVGTDIQHNNCVFISNHLSENDIKKCLFTNITAHNLIPTCIYMVLRKVISPTWYNDRDQYIHPNNKWSEDIIFQSDCLVYALYVNTISSQYGINHWIPFTEEEVGAQECFKSHFMNDYISGRHHIVHNNNTDLFSFEEENPRSNLVIQFSTEATAVMDAGRELWRYYHVQPNANPNASLYDIKMHFQGTKTLKSGKVQMNSNSDDTHYTELIGNLRLSLKLLAARIEPKVYEYGFLKR